MPEFLPISRADMTRRGWDQCDFVYIIGDGYVDHPSFGHAIISRVLEDAGYKVGILSQPDWKDPASIDALGEPKSNTPVSGGAYQDARKVTLVWNDNQKLGSQLNSGAGGTNRVQALFSPLSFLLREKR